MAGGNGMVHESLDLVGRAASEVTPALLSALTTYGSHQVVQVGPCSIQCVRTRRPTWATVLGVLGLLFFGLGILFFFVKRTDMCTITVVDGPRGAVATISGSLDQQALLRLRAALDPSSGSPTTAGASSPVGDLSLLPPPAGGPVSSPVLGVPAQPMPTPPIVALLGPASSAPAPAPWTPPPALVPIAPATPMASSSAEHTVARGLVPPPAAGTPVGSYRVRFDHGPIAEILAPVLVGRDPVPAAEGMRGATLLAIPDPTMSVSKTHLLLRAHEGRLWVDDLHSTNGTAVVHPGGERVVAAPGSPVVVPLGAVIEFGDRRAEVLVG